MTYLTELEQARLDEQAARGRGAHPQLHPLPTRSCWGALESLLGHGLSM